MEEKHLDHLRAADEMPDAVEQESLNRDDLADDIPVTMETVLKDLGVPGRYQLIQIISTCICVTPFAFVMLNFVFIGYEPSATCNIENETEILRNFNFVNSSEVKVGYDSCVVTIATNSTGDWLRNDVTSLECDNGYRYDEHKQISMVSEWDLVCDKRGTAEIVQTVITLGMAVSSALVTRVADHYGRKRVFLFNVASIIVTETALYFTSTVYLAIVLRLLTGLSAGAMYVIHNVISSELIISKYRHLYGQCNCMLWSFNVMLLSGVAYLLKDNWRDLQLTTALCGIPAFFSLFILNETPLWYFAQGRYEMVEKVVLKACKTNGKKTQPVIKTLHKCIAQSSGKGAVLDSSSNSDPDAKYSFVDIWHNRTLLKTVVILCVVWFTNATTYFGLYLTSSTVAGDRYLNFFLMALLEIPSSVTCMFMLTYLGRRTVMLIFVALSGISLLVSTSLVATDSGSSQDPDASTAFFLFGKFAIGSSYNVFAAYTPELFPTTIRTTGTGLCAAFACVGAMLAPFLNPLFKIVPWAPGAILTSMCFMSFFLIWSIPETKGRELPTTVGEIMEWK